MIKFVRSFTFHFFESFDSSSSESFSSNIRWKNWDNFRAFDLRLSDGERLAGEGPEEGYLESMRISQTEIC